jgi:hypothetical protein
MLGETAGAFLEILGGVAKQRIDYGVSGVA